MAACIKLKTSLPRSNPFPQLQLRLQQRFSHSFVDQGSELGSASSGLIGSCKMEHNSNDDRVDTSLWRKVDSRNLGIMMSMIPESPRIVLKILQNEGHDAYLVGGCVRDLLLHRIPKDFDVVTSANLKQIKRKFHRAYIVGRRFPICMVHLRGSVVEVSSFETIANNATEIPSLPLSKMPKGLNDKDFMRWKNSLRRDFTINSLFYDPFAHKIYDYSSGMKDLRAMKVRTLVPAEQSFKEDCARILRGIRIAARLELSIAQDTNKAIIKLSSSLMSLDKARIMMEMNYMLSYGAAEPSLLLLRRFKILELLLPFQNAYLSQHSGAQSPAMLMKLFFNLDRVASCDKPCNDSLWVSLLTFHLALISNPQDALVVWTFASLLYHGKWKEGLKAARELSVEDSLFRPELFKSSDDITDEELGRRVASFAEVVLDSIYMLTNSESLYKAMCRYPCSASSGLVFISKNAGKEVSAIFNVLVNDIESLEEERCYYSIDYNLLGKGDIRETRFVLGKIIMDTMTGGQSYDRTKRVEKKQDDLLESEEKVQGGFVSSLVTKHKDRDEQGSGVTGDRQCHKETKKQKRSMQTAIFGRKLEKKKLGEILSSQEIAQKRNQLRKMLVKDVRKLLSSQKEAAPKNAVVESGLCFGTQEEIISVLRDMRKMANHEGQDPEEIMGVLEMGPEINNPHTAYGPEEVLAAFKKAPQLPDHHQIEESLTEMVNVTNLSNIFKSDDSSSKKLCNAEKQPIAGDPHLDESIGKKRKLSNIFR